MPTQVAVTPLTFDNWLQAVATLAVIPLTTVPLSGLRTTESPDFNSIIPQMLNYAELRIQRDLDLVAAQTSRDGYTLLQDTDTLSIPNEDFISIQNIQLFDGTRKRVLTAASKEFMQAVFDDLSYTSIPKYYCVTGGDALTGGATSFTVQFGPAPNINFDLIITGATRLPSLAKFLGTPQQTTGTTFISTWLPDLLIMASMIFASGYQRNWSSTSDDPQMAVNYEKQYEMMKSAAFVEEARKRFAARDWTSLAPAPIAAAAGG